MAAIETRLLEFPINAHTAPGYLARPAGGQAHPGVVVIQEWWGLVPHIKDVAGRLARAGFVALAPDLYHGQAADEPDEARKLAMALDAQRAVQEIAAAARYLKKMDQDAAPRKVGVVGWLVPGRRFSAVHGGASRRSHRGRGGILWPPLDGQRCGQVEGAGAGPVRRARSWHTGGSGARL